MPQLLDSRSPFMGRHKCDVAIVGAGLAGLTVDCCGGVRCTYQGMSPPGSGNAEAEVRDGARLLTQLAGELPLGRPWEAPRAADWDGQTYHSWLAENVSSPLAQQSLARALEGVFGGGPGEGCAARTDTGLAPDPELCAAQGAPAFLTRLL